MKRPIKILIVEDSADDAMLIEWELKKAGMAFTWLVVTNKAEFDKALIEYGPELVLSDHFLPDFNSLEAFEILRSYEKTTGATVPFILVTGSVSEEFAVRFMKAGIDEYILKDRLKRLPLAIERAMEKDSCGRV